MEALEDTIRAANPAPVNPDQPLDLRAEQDLRAIISGSIGVPHLASRRRAIGRRAVLIGVGAAAAAAAGVIATVSWPRDPAHPIGTDVAQAAGPKMLEVRPLSATAAEVIADARQKLLAPDPAGFKPGYYKLSSWLAGNESLPGGKSGAPTILPQTMIIRRDADGTGTLTRIVGQPFSPTDPNVKYALPPIIGVSPDGNPQPVKPGEAWTVPLDPKLSPEARKTLKGDPYPKPPADDASMAAWIHDFQSKATAMVYEDAQGVFQMMEVMSRDWNLSNAQQRAYLSVIAAIPGVTTLGAVTDRLGRPGTAVYLDSPKQWGTYRNILVIDDATGRILDSEEDYIAGPTDGTKPIRPVTSVSSYAAFADA
ncbi:hypothetical protein [Sinomonas sp. G460-2]|uniref:hypothetical protein n=1 Tax=Sinomonas sp. G460-2 TaxID=3393464 RepID=UPI0039EF4568